MNLPEEIVTASGIVLTIVTWTVVIQAFRISNFRWDLVQKINRASDADGPGPWGSSWRYEALHRLPWKQMQRQPWKPLAMYITNDRFIRPLPESSKEVYRTFERSVGRCNCRLYGSSEHCPTHGCTCGNLSPNAYYVDCPVHGIVFGQKAITIYPTRYSAALGTTLNTGR